MEELAKETIPYIAEKFSESNLFYLVVAIIILVFFYFVMRITISVIQKGHEKSIEEIRKSYETSLKVLSNTNEKLQKTIEKQEKIIISYSKK